MNQSHFPPENDPGPDFAALARQAGLWPEIPTSLTGAEVPHGTTCVAVRHSEGVVMAGDRRATSGNFISHRSIEKVFPADQHSGVAIAGAAGPALELVRLFQLQLEHYEKVEGSPVSLEGKANQLSQMVRNHLPAAMSGLAVVPLFAGFDTSRGLGRLFQYDITGGRYEEHDYASAGSGSLHAGTVIKLGWAPQLDMDEAIDLTLRSLLEAADEDSATGGPDMLRRIFPVVANIGEAGFERVADDDLEQRFVTLFDQLAATRGWERDSSAGGTSS